MTSEDEVAALRRRLEASETAYSKALKDIAELQEALRRHGLVLTSWATATPIQH